MGATVSRMRIELIFRGCWNLVTPRGQHSTAGETRGRPMRWVPIERHHGPGHRARSFPNSGNGVRPRSPLCRLSGRQRYLRMHKSRDMQRSIPRFVLETIAMAAMVVLLLYVLVGSPT